MRLSISFAARGRSFGKAMRRIRPCFDSLCQEFERQALQDPVHEALLVGITDELPDSELREVKNREGFFQVLCGFDSHATFTSENDPHLKGKVFEKISAAVEVCPFSRRDRECYRQLLAKWSSIELPG